MRAGEDGGNWSCLHFSSIFFVHVDFFLCPTGSCVQLELQSPEKTVSWCLEKRRSACEMFKAGRTKWKLSFAVLLESVAAEVVELFVSAYEYAM